MADASALVFRRAVTAPNRLCGRRHGAHTALRQAVLQSMASGTRPTTWPLPTRFTCRRFVLASVCGVLPAMTATCGVGLCGFPLRVAVSGISAARPRGHRPTGSPAVGGRGQGFSTIAIGRCRDGSEIDPRTWRTAPQRSSAMPAGATRASWCRERHGAMSPYGSPIGPDDVCGSGRQ